MNDRDPGLVRQLLAVLELRQAEAPTPARAATIAELAAALEPGRRRVPLPEIVEAVERSSLGSEYAQAMRRETTPRAVADVLARVERLAARGGPATDPAGPGTAPVAETVLYGPVADWSRELTTLREQAGGVAEKILVELAGMGLDLTADGLDAVLTAPPVSLDRELVRSVVTVLGGDWTGEGYEASYDAALDEQRRLDGRLGAATGRQDVSGLAGADPLTTRTLLRQAQAEVELLPPVVRGRDDLVAELVELLGRPPAGPRVLVGAAGSGKSTVARAVAAVATERSLRVWWVPAGDPNQIVRGMLAVATQLGAPVADLNALQADPATGAELLWRRLDGSATGWLLVFDGADDPDLLAVPSEDGPCSWLRSSPAGTVMVTSRECDPERWDPSAVLTGVGDLTPDAGALVVLDRARRRGAPGSDAAALAGARALSVQVGGVALALRILGSCIGAAGADMASVAAALPRGPVDDSAAGRIAQAWRLAVDGLADRGMPEARTLLRLLALYAPAWVIPLEVITPVRLAHCGLPTGADGGDALGVWRRALDGLRLAGLVGDKLTAGAQVPGVVVHPLVAEVSRLAGPAGAAVDGDAIEAAAVDVLLRATTGLDAGRPAHWPALRRLEPHAYALLDNLVTAEPGIRSAALRLANRIAEGLIRAGLFALGEALIRHAQSRTSALGPHAADRLDAEYTLARALGLRGELADSEARLRKLLLELRRIGRNDTPRALAVRDHLAWVLAEQGRLDEAHRRFRDLLPECERVLGREHRDTLAVRHRIAWITALRGRPAEAVDQFASLLPQRIAALGPDHMEVLSSRYRLAWARSHAGHQEQAEAEFLDLLGDVERVFDPDSAAVIMVRARLAWIRTWTCRFPQAEADYRTVLEARTRVLGAHHPRTLRARVDLGWVLGRRGDHRGAERLYREVLAEVERTPELGRDHPLALDTSGQITLLLVEAGRLDEAARRARALVTHQRRVSGPDHPATLLTRRTLGVVLAARGRLGEAERHLDVVAADQERLLGPDHRHTLETRAEFASVIGRRGRLDEAQSLIEDVLRAREQVLGPLHPHTLASRQQVVWVLGERDELAEARDRCRALIAAQRTVMGPLHPDTLSARYRLGWLLALAGRGAEAAEAYRALVADQHRVLGREHPHTLRSRHGLAAELLRAGRYEDGERELRNILIDRIPLLGRDHPDTLANRHSLAFALFLRGSLPESERSMQAVLLDQLAALGPDHRNTLATRERLAWIQERQGRLADAGDNWKALASDRERLLGHDHPDTRRAWERLAAFSHEVSRWW